MKVKRLAAGLILLAFAALSLSGCAEKTAEAPVNETCIRLHVLANSDSEEDQAAKLKVRDAVLALSRERLTAADRDTALSELLSMGGELQTAAEETLASLGMDCGVSVLAGEFDFPDRTYGDKLYPAGRYEAVRIILGEGEGRNWWCVMFPPLCVIDDSPEYREDGALAFKSFFIELWRGIFG